MPTPTDPDPRSHPTSATDASVDAELARLWDRRHLLNVVKRLADRRQRAGITTQAMADRLGVTRRRMRGIDAGVACYGELARYALAVGCRLVVSIELPEPADDTTAAT